MHANPESHEVWVHDEGQQSRPTHTCVALLPRGRVSPEPWSITAICQRSCSAYHHILPLLPAHLSSLTPSLNSNLLPSGGPALLPIQRAEPGEGRKEGSGEFLQVLLEVATRSHNQLLYCNHSLIGTWGIGYTREPLSLGTSAEGLTMPAGKSGRE